MTEAYISYKLTKWAFGLGGLKYTSHVNLHINERLLNVKYNKIRAMLILIMISKLLLNGNNKNVYEVETMFSC